MKKLMYLLIMTVVMSLSFVSCDEDGNDDSKGLEGTSWSRQVTSSTFDFTYTIKFTSSNEATHTQKGWGMVGKEKKNYNDTKKGTYVYYPEIQEGWVNNSAFSGGKLVFAISGNKLSSMTGSSVYTKD